MTSFAQQSWTELIDRRVLLIPIGSTEQHGPHLPLDTDSFLAERFALAAQEKLGDDVTVAPVLAYGASGEHQGFPGTLSIGTETLTAVLVELGRSAFPLADNTGVTNEYPFHSLIFVNGHGGNETAAQRAVRLLQGEKRPVTSWSPRVPGGDAHAGHTETSLMLYLAPEQVRAAYAVKGNDAPLSTIFERLRSDGVRAVSPTGVLGDPTTATAAHGKALFESLVDHLAQHVRAATKDSKESERVTERSTCSVPTAT